MGWVYHFVNLTEEQKHHRRQLLDWYAALAQVSVLVPLLVIQCYFLASWLERRWRSQASLEPPSSPYAKDKKTKHKSSIKSARSVLRQIQWWAGDPITILGYDLGTKGEVLGTAVWTAWLLLLCFLQTGEDYLHLTKRFGLVASSQLPFHYLLALKSPYSPLSFLFRSSHETLNSLHQLLGRIVTFLLYLHAALYVNFYVLSNLLAAKITQLYVICGIVGIIAFTAVGTTALTPVRRWNYKVFYITHVTLATALLPVLFFHVSHIRIYLYETAIVYALNILLRALSSRTFPATIKLVPQASLVEIDVVLPKSGPQRPGLTGLQPGQHAYVSLAGYPLLRTFRSNPFTVASLPAVDGNLRFVARILDGNTAKLAQSAAKRTHNVTVEGPYGLSTHPEQLLQYDRILLVAGGVGATFTVPLYRQLLADLSPSKGSYRRQKVSFVWIARSKADVMWAMPEDAKEKEGFVERLKVCLTGATTEPGSTTNGSFAIGDDVQEDGDEPSFGEPDEGIELEEQKKLLQEEPNGMVGKEGDGLSTYAGRPDLARLVNQTFSHGSAETVAIVVCGPRSLTMQLRSRVGRWVKKGREVWFWQESFAL